MIKTTQMEILEIAAKMSGFRCRFCKGSLMKVHYPKLYNMAHLLALNVLLLPKDLTIIFIPLWSICFIFLIHVFGVTCFAICPIYVHIYVWATEWPLLWKQLLTRLTASATFRRKLHLSKMSPCPDPYPNPSVWWLKMWTYRLVFYGINLKILR